MIMILMLTLCFTGCSGTPSKLDHSTAYPLSAAEYQMNVNHKLTPLISSLQPLANCETVDETNANLALDAIQKVYNGISALNPPKDKVTYQAELLNNLNLLTENIKYHSGLSDAEPEINFEDALTMVENAFHVSVN